MEGDFYHDEESGSGEKSGDEKFTRTLERIEMELISLRQIVSQKYPKSPPFKHDGNKEASSDKNSFTHSPTNTYHRRFKMYLSWISPDVKKHFLLITLGWYTLLLIPVLLTGNSSHQDFRELIAIDAMMFLAFIFQFGMMIFIIFVTVDFVHDIASHGNLSTWFLLESYVSTIILFASFYFLIFRLDPDSFDVRGDTEEKNFSIFDVFQFWCRAFYFSVTVMVTEGFGDITPLSWWTQILVAIEEVVGVVYTSLVLAKGFSFVTERKSFPVDDVEPEYGDDVALLELERREERE